MRIVNARRPLPALTGIRCIAAFLVVLFHFQFLTAGLAPSTSPMAQVIHSGYVGVSLFFVLSGFILAYTYVTPDGRLRGSGDAFWQARFARVYPVYLFALIFSAPLFVDVAFIHPEGVTHLSDIVKSAIVTPLLLQAWTPKKAWMWNGPAWSLSAEAFFYLLFPAVGAAIARRGKRGVLAIGAIAFAAALLGPAIYALTSGGGIRRVTPGTYGPWIAFLKFSPLVHLPQFVIGIVAGVIFLRREENVSAARAAGWTASLTSAAILALLAVSQRIPYLLLNAGLLAPLFALLIYALASGRGALSAALSTRPARLLGGASYALYLIHLPVALYLTRVWTRVTGQSASGVLALAIYLLVSVALALLIFTFIEEPARRALRARPAWRLTPLVRAIALQPVRIDGDALRGLYSAVFGRA